MYKLLLALLGIYLVIVILLFFIQKRFIFYPTILPDDYSFGEFENFEECYFEPKAGVKIHALYFKAANPKGVILYFHGNAGALDSWGHAAQTFVPLGYDVLMPDYRGYGKVRGLYMKWDSTMMPCLSTIILKSSIRLRKL